MDYFSFAVALLLSQLLSLGYVLVLYLVPADVRCLPRDATAHVSPQLPACRTPRPQYHSLGLFSALLERHSLQYCCGPARRGRRAPGDRFAN